MDLVADAARLREIFDQDTFPLILPTPMGGQADKLSLKAYQNLQDYVAVSHVWSQGLGNPNENAMYSCQVQKISEMVQSLPVKSRTRIMPFWLDTICCPVEDNKYQDKAIGLMRRTYENARAVLVLDAALQVNKHRQLLDGDVLLRIFSCRWNSRLWTFQEGALAERLFFQFADGAYDIQAGIDRLQSQPQVSTTLTIAPSILRHFQSLRFFRDDKKAWSTSQKLVVLSWALQFRSTSQPTDEPICLFTLLGYSTEEMMATEKNRRMQFFCNKLEDSPYRWAPRSFMSSKLGLPALEHYITLNQKTDTAHFYEDGLQCRASCLEVFMPENRPFPPIWQLFWLRDQNGTWYGIEVRTEDHKDKVAYNHKWTKSCSHFYNTYKILPPSQSDKHSQIFLMFSQDDEQSHSFSATALLLFGNRSSDQIFATPICAAFVIKVSPALHAASIKAMDKALEKQLWIEGPGELAFARATYSKDRDWIL
ncbi:hypothetical protein BT63DRAFT_423984, partial [Microthyrium microscopicum]